MEGYITTAEYAELHGITQVAAKKRCVRGRIPGAVKVGKRPHEIWLIPIDAEFTDERIKTGKYIGAQRAHKTPSDTEE